MRIGQFFSLNHGQVGQYLSSRVLLVRQPFQMANPDRCYFGFDELNQAQRFAQYLASQGYSFQLRSHQLLPQRYEIELFGNCQLAKTLAYWDRKDQAKQRSRPSLSQVAQQAC
ncbi:hypothetical protein [Alkalinema sp. FACHB-956]|uniref:hypothetical protein n=1 Tax=Alkalinema sp. FACHB-956 TaxID=2692768 RepID=UPI0016865F02|nr:hypothetical protein [Alkalinema sp. FACHB-956]MBD2326090.1 hypothetical protein [Alkalinema sp. FACHB-956]